MSQVQLVDSTNRRMKEMEEEISLLRAELADTRLDAMRYARMDEVLLLLRQACANIATGTGGK